MSKRHRHREVDQSQLNLFSGGDNTHSNSSCLEDSIPSPDTLHPTEEAAEARQPVSGAIGGPSTARGVRYQLDYAVVQALKGMSRALSNLKNLTIGLEPRTVTASETLGWDLLITPPALLIEVKLKPKSQDILEWLKQVTRNVLISAEYKYRLVYGSPGTPLLNSLFQLTRLAAEIGSDEEKFKEIISLEGNRDVRRVLDILGDSYLEILNSIELHNVPPHSLEDTIDVLARQMSGHAGGRQLTNFLLTRFSVAMGHRLNLSVKQLINEARGQGIKLQPPPEIDYEDLSHQAAAALFVLDCCPAPIPLEVLAKGVHTEPMQLAADLEPLREEQVLTIKDGLCSLTPQPVKPNHPEGSASAASTLDFLVDYVKGRPASTYLESQVRNIKELAQISFKKHPKIVATIFSRLDKVLKDLGTKHAVLDIANLSIEASRVVTPRTPAEVDSEARALICGKSWVYQRVSRLHEAVAAAERSLQLSEDTGLDVTSAYAVKCAGRLSRMKAERLPEKSKEREECIRQSITRLKEAIEKFGSLAAFGKEHPEVGDCYSLLGRTFLVAGLPREAHRMVRMAFRLIEEGTKDHLDLLLLAAELDGKENSESARQLYEEAVKLCSAKFPENSEMRARALLGRGRHRLTLGDTTGAAEDLKRASEIWSSLGEQEMAAEAKWEILRSETVSHRGIELLESQNLSTLVKVRAAEIYASQKAPSAIANRAEPSDTYWHQVIAKAKKELALELNEW